MVVGDYFTKWIEAYCLRNQEAKTIADVLTREFIARFGAPLEIHSDQGRNFEEAIMKDVCSILGIRKTRTPAFRPQLTDWDQIVPMVVCAYRPTPQERQKKWTW